jgi:hypothetical protein
MGSSGIFGSHGFFFGAALTLMTLAVLWLCVG